VKLLAGVLLIVGLWLATPSAAGAQQTAPRIEEFVGHVTRLWSAGDAAGLARLAPADGRISLELGPGASGSVQARHAAAALRALFGGRSTVSVQPVRITVSGGDPLRGFGELAWVSRSRGVTVPFTSTVYVGTVWEGEGWRIREIRLMR
jgi:hypothetical protein